MHPEIRQRPRRLAALFLAVTALPTAGLVWLGLQLLAADRDLARQHLTDRLEGIAATIAAELRRDLDTVDVEHAVVADSIDAVHVTFGADGVTSRRGAPLPFVPVLHVVAEPDAPIWREGMAAEDAKQHGRAAAMYRRLAVSAEPRVRAGALVRLARVERGAGQHDTALATYARLAELGGVPLFGEPADLLARKARLRMFTELRRDDVRAREAATIRRDLVGGRWAIDGPTFELAWSESGGQPLDVPSEVSRGIALAIAVDTLWREWHDARAARASDWRGERTFWHGETAITLVWRANATRLQVLAATSEFFASRWRRFWEPRGVAVALLDTDGRVVLGDAMANPVTRGLAATGLPWTLRLASRAPADDLAALAGRRRLLMLVLLIASFLVLAGAYFVARGVRREIEVARLQSDFVSAVSHEFRTPLTSMSHLVELLRDRPLDDVRRRRYYEALDQETGRLRRFVDELLEFGRVDAGRARYALKPADPASLVAAVVERFTVEPAVGPRPIELDAERGLPAVAVDAPAVELALRNLLDNAAKYSPGGAPIRVRVARAGADVVVHVSDDGPGIPRHEQTVIFEKFVRGDGARHSTVGGTGIGLALAREIMRAHHGDVTVASEPGRGSTFTLSLPAVAGSESAA